MPRSENDIQRDIVTFLTAVLPPKEARVFAIPNASRRTITSRAGNGVPGLTPGVPDLQIIAKGGRAYFLEVKSDVGRLSPVQSAFKAWCVAADVPHAVARSVDDVRELLGVWGVKTREAVKCKS
jgi:hypothetical protein